MRRNVYGRIAHRAKYLVRGEMSMGRIAQGAKCPYMGQNVHVVTVSGVKSLDTIIQYLVKCSKQTLRLAPTLMAYEYQTAWQ